MADYRLWKIKNLATKFKYYPSEMMVRALFSDFYFNNKIKKKGKCLDIGTLHTANLLPFYERGWSCYGTEVTNSSLKYAKKMLKKNKIKATLNIGYNNKLNFKSNYFDLVLSFSTIHYEESVEDISLSLKEMARVMKKNSTLLIQTLGPTHFLTLKSKKIGRFKYKLNYKSDKYKRNRQIFTFFKKPFYLIRIMKKYFRVVESSRIIEKYPKNNFDMYLFKLIK